MSTDPSLPKHVDVVVLQASGSTGSLEGQIEYRMNVGLSAGLHRTHTSKPIFNLRKAKRCAANKYIAIANALHIFKCYCNS
jgi:hypothetical protein